MKKKSSPFKSSLIGGVIVLTFFSFVFFLIGAFVYKTICKQKDQENYERYTELQEELDSKQSPDTVMITKQRTDTVVVYVNPAPKAPVVEKASTEKPVQQQKDTKDLKPAIQTPKSPVKSSTDTSASK